MGYWVCDDFPGERFYEEKDVKRFLGEELDEMANRMFPDWLESNYTVHTLLADIRTKKSGKEAAEDIFVRCEDQVWNDNSSLWEGFDGTALEHRFYWEFDDREGMFDRKPRFNLFKRKWPAKRIVTKRKVR